MAAHTPGPWRVHKHLHIHNELWLSIGFHTTEGTSDPNGRWVGPVAELKHLVAREDEQWANAHLIAAAPDLLEALKAVEWKPFPQLLEEESQWVFPHRCASCEQFRGSGHKADCKVAAAIAKAEGQS